MQRKEFVTELTGNIGRLFFKTLERQKLIFMNWYMSERSECRTTDYCFIDKRKEFYKALSLRKRYETILVTVVGKQTSCTQKENKLIEYKT